MAKRSTATPLFDLLRSRRHHYTPENVLKLFSQVTEERVESLAASLSSYITTNLPRAIERRDAIADYRTNPYVLLTSANVMKLGNPAKFADFLFNNKLYMGLETSFGKSIEAAFVVPYPLHDEALHKWIDPPEKLAEAAALVGLSRETKARRRLESVWREIDKSCVIGSCRYMTSVKSGPNCINDTQVQAMVRAILDNYQTWMNHTKKTYSSVDRMDVVIGITYGTDRTTNNKENQILIKLLEQGFEEEDRRKSPGVLIDSKTHKTRVYRLVGKDFWAFIGNPVQPSLTEFVFLEVLLSLAKALSQGMAAADLEEAINRKIQGLTTALGRLTFPRKSLPEWVREDFDEDELFWFATAMTAFYDEGI